MHQVASVL